MKKKLIAFLVVLCFTMSTMQIFADTTYTIRSGDTMWKIAQKYQVGISEIISKNPQVKNPSMIYPGQKLTIPTTTAINSMENEVIRLTNIERSKKGLGALKANWQLSRCARYKSQDMINKNYFAHQSPTYGSPFDMIESFGISMAAGGENIAMGQRTPQEVVTAWMNSPGHRSNILSTAYTEIGVGCAKSSNGSYYWTQMFIRPGR
ncbi:MAG TPA: SafA/ExsA family spore coat assembly protein [Clostridia bacterium]|nr:SafA/ExsA family spore coat assembly protein [Clostridia bacterium]